MSGLGGIVVFALIATLSLTAIGYLAGVMRTGTSLAAEINIMIQEEAVKSVGRLEIANLTILPDNTTIRAEIINKALKSIPLRNLNLMDIILVYESQGAIRAAWIPYRRDGEGLEGWHVTDITQGEAGEIINPSSRNFTTGMWDPGETLHIEIRLNPSHPATGTTLLIASTPEGAMGWRAR